MTRLARAERVLERIVILAALIASLTLSVAYKGQVNDLRGSLSSSCVSRTIQHEATHRATAALIAYYRTELTLLNAFYPTELKIIRSYPKPTQRLAIDRLGQNRTALQNVLAAQTAAYTAESTFYCAH